MDQRTKPSEGQALRAAAGRTPGDRASPERLRWTLALIAATAALFVTVRHVIYAAIGHANDESFTLGEFGANVGHDLAPFLGAALVMLGVIEPVRRFGPAAGWRRVGAIAAGVLVATVAASAFWVAYFWMMSPTPGDDQTLLSVFSMYLPRFFALGAMLTAVGEFYRSEVRSLEAMRAAEADRAALEQQTLQARLKTLEAQIEPHFLFNTLANLRRLYETDAAAGDAMLDHLMRYLQVALPSIRDEHTTLEREAQLIHAYLELQQVRMGRRLAFVIDIEPALRPLQVPPMMLLTLVENAIKHGLAPLREGGRIDVAARLVDGELQLEVADTGRGFGGDTAGGGTGLANIRARLAAMFGAAARFTLATRDPQGLRATIRIPVVRPPVA